MTRQLLTSLLFCTAILGASVTVQAQSASSTSNKDLVLTLCQAQAAPQCDCMADQLESTLSSQQWVILRAAVNRDAQPPAGTTEQDLGALAEKMNQALQACAQK